jgi:hypothetical protein
MVIHLVANFGYLLAKRLSLFEATKRKATLDVVKIFRGRPSIITSSANNVRNYILIHFL